VRELPSDPVTFLYIDIGARRSAGEHGGSRVKRALLRDASNDAAGTSCEADESGQSQSHDIRLDAGPAGVAADGGHGSVVAVLPSSLGEPACGEGFHIGSVSVTAKRLVACSQATCRDALLRGVRSRAPDAPSAHLRGAPRRATAEAGRVSDGAVDNAHAAEYVRLERWESRRDRALCPSHLRAGKPRNGPSRII